MNCPICNTLIKISSDDPSPEYRGQMDNMYQGTPPTDYYFYQGTDQEGEDFKRHKREYFDKQKKNFPGNKNTYPQLETPEDMPTIARPKSDDFVYAKCGKCGHRIIKTSEAEKKEEIIQYEIYDEEDLDEQFIKIKTDSDRILYYPVSDLTGFSHEQVLQFIQKNLPSNVKKLMSEYEDNWKNYSNEYDFYADFNYDLDQNETTEYYSDKLDDKLYQLIEDEVLEHELKVAREYGENKYSEEDDLYNLTYGYDEHFGNMSLDDILQHFNQNLDWGYFIKEGNETAEYDIDYSINRGDIGTDDLLKNAEFWLEDVTDNDNWSEIKSEYIDGLKKSYVNYVGSQIGYVMARNFYFKIIEALSNQSHEDFFEEIDGEMIKTFPNEYVKNFIVNNPEFFVFDTEEFTLEQLESIPIKGYIDDEALRRYNLAFKYSSESEDQMKFFSLKTARQPDMNFDDAYDHGTNPTDKNNPSNQDPIMGDDFSRVDSSVEEEDKIKRIYDKTRNGINFRFQEEKAL